MKLALAILIFTAGCTTGSFNPETNEFTFISTKEFDSFEIKFKDGGKELNIKADKVKAFEGQKIIADTIKDTAGKIINPF